MRKFWIALAEKIRDYLNGRKVLGEDDPGVILNYASRHTEKIGNTQCYRKLRERVDQIIRSCRSNPDLNQNCL